MDSEERQLLKKVAADVSTIKAQLKAQHLICQYENERIGRIEKSVGKQGFLATLFGAIGATVVLMIKVVMDS
jgi:hypothetical protein